MPIQVGSMYNRYSTRSDELMSATFSKLNPHSLASTLAGVGAGECGASLAYILLSWTPKRMGLLQKFWTIHSKRAKEGCVLCTHATSKAALSCTTSKRQPRSIWAFPVSVSTLSGMNNANLKKVFCTCRADTNRLTILGFNWLKLVCWCLKVMSVGRTLLTTNIWYQPSPLCWSQIFDGHVGKV